MLLSGTLYGQANYSVAEWGILRPPKTMQDILWLGSGTVSKYRCIVCEQHRLKHSLIIKPLSIVQMLAQAGSTMEPDLQSSVFALACVLPACAAGQLCHS